MALFSRDSFLAVDIGTTSIKVGEFRRVGEGVELVNYSLLESRAHLDGSGSAIQTSSFRMLEPLVIDYLRKLVKKMSTRTKAAIVSLPAFSIFTTLIELPKMSDKDTAKAIPFQSRQYIPAPLSTVRIEWFPVGESEDEEGNIMQQVFLMSVPHSTIDKYKRVFKSAGLKMIDSEVESVSLARIVSTGFPEPILIIDIGSRSTGISVAEDGMLREAAQTDFAGSSLTQVLATGLDITLSRAESLKVQKGLTATGGAQGLSTLMTPMLDAIISEAVRAVRSFEKNYERSVTRAVLSGGTARLFGISDYFSTQLGMPVETTRPFERIAYPQALTPLLEGLSPQFAVMLGLANKPR